jgi:hypothetical protein
MEDNTIYLSATDYQQILDALDKADEPNVKLVELFNRVANNPRFVDICTDCTDNNCKVCNASNRS